jgi:hypothetical protein
MCGCVVLCNLLDSRENYQERHFPSVFVSENFGQWKGNSMGTSEGLIYPLLCAETSGV